MDFGVHGEPSSPHHSHSILLPDCTLLSLEDPKLINLLEQIKAKKNKIGFLDESCYGGGSLPVLKKYGCVLADQIKDFASSIAPRERIFGLQHEEKNITGGSTSLEELLKVDKPVTMNDVYVSVLLNNSHEAREPQFAVESDDESSIKSATAAAYVTREFEASKEYAVIDLVNALQDPESVEKMKEKGKQAYDYYANIFIHDYEKEDWLYRLRSKRSRLKHLNRRMEKNYCSQQDKGLEALRDQLFEVRNKMNEQKILELNQLKPEIERLTRHWLLIQYDNKGNSYPHDKNKELADRGDLSYENQLKRAETALQKLQKEKKDSQAFDDARVEFAIAINILRAYDFLDKNKKSTVKTPCASFVF